MYIGLGLAIVNKIMGAIGGGITFLLRDDFMVNVAAPLASPRTAEPGPGTLTLVQVDGEYSISSGNLAFPAHASAAWSEQGMYEAGGRSRAAGRTLLTSFNVAVDGDIIAANFSTVASTAFNAAGNGNFWGSGRILYWLDTNFYNSGLSLSLATAYKFAVILRTSGAFHFVKGGAFASWTLFMVSSQCTTATHYPQFNTQSGSGTLDFVRVLDLPAPFASDYGLATQRLSGAQSAGVTFTHEANCVIEFVFTTLASSGNMLVNFRVQDASNYWQLWWAQFGGALTLTEVVGGVRTDRASASPSLANGHRAVIVADGSTIRVYTNNVLRFTYSSASNFATATAGELNGLGVGGAVSDIISWPRTLSGAAAALLDLAVA